MLTVEAFARDCPEKLSKAREDDAEEQWRLSEMRSKEQISSAGSRTGDNKADRTDRPPLCLWVSRISTGQQVVVLPRYSGWTGWTARWPMSMYSCGRPPCCAWNVCGFGSDLSFVAPESLLPLPER